LALARVCSNAARLIARPVVAARCVVVEARLGVAVGVIVPLHRMPESPLLVPLFLLIVSGQACLVTPARNVPRVSRGSEKPDSLPRRLQEEAFDTVSAGKTAPQAPGCYAPQKSA
jgi:hypothetical protein